MGSPNELLPAQPVHRPYRMRQVVLTVFAISYSIVLYLLYSSSASALQVNRQHLPPDLYSPDRYKYLASESFGTVPFSDRPLAVIVQPHERPGLIPLLLQFSTVLGPTWGVVLYILQDNWATPGSASFRRAARSGRIEVRFLPKDNPPDDDASVSRFLTRQWLWQQLQFSHRVLLFDMDSIVCSGASMNVMPENFVKYDFVAAPGRHQHSGSLSLRNPRLCLDIAQESDFEKSSAESEEQWFLSEARARGANLPKPEVAKSFVVEDVYHERPLGYHWPRKWGDDKLREIEEYCPEVKMLTTGHRR